MPKHHVMIVFFDVKNAKHGEWYDAGHSPGVFPPENYVKVWEGDIEYEGPTSSLLNHLWNITQNDFFPASWRGALTGWGMIDVCRSSAMGDVFYVDGTWYKVASAGFGPLTNNNHWDETASKFVGHDFQWQGDAFSKHFLCDGNFQLNSVEDVNRAIAQYHKGR